MLIAGRRGLAADGARARRGVRPQRHRVAGKGNNGNDGRAAAERSRRRCAVPVFDAANCPTGSPAPTRHRRRLWHRFHGEWRAPRRGTCSPPTSRAASTGSPARPPGGGGRRTARSPRSSPASARRRPDLAGEVEVVDIGLDAGRSAIRRGGDVAPWWLPRPPRRTSRHALSRRRRQPGHDRRRPLAAAPPAPATSWCSPCPRPGIEADRPPEVVGGRPGVDGTRRCSSCTGSTRSSSDRASAVRSPQPLCGHGRRRRTGRRRRRRPVRPLGPDGAGAAYRRDPPMLTPHDGEFDLACRAPTDADRSAPLAARCRHTGVVLLKGPTTVVAAPGGAVLVVASGDARLATAGTRDVLSGTSAHFSPGMDPFPAAAAAACIHAAAAARGRRRDRRRRRHRRPARRPRGAADDTMHRQAGVGRYRPRAIPHNVAVFRAAVAPAAVWAVVKADGYGQARRRRPSALERERRACASRSAEGVALRGRRSTRRSSCSPSNPPKSRRRSSPTASPRPSTTADGATRGDRRRRRRRPRQGRHRYAPRRCPPVDVRVGRGDRGGARRCGWPASSPTSRSPTTRRPVHG